MASINGVAIKNYKMFHGYEGDAAQGTIYLNGKRLGFWSQDGWGGPDRFDFDEHFLDKAVEDYKKGLPTDYKYLDILDAECFLDKLVFFKETEKDLKRFFRQGHAVAIVASNHAYRSILATPHNLGDKALLTTYAKEIEEMKSELCGNVDVSIFRPDSFDITVDAKHKAPTYLTSK